MSGGTGDGFLDRWSRRKRVAGQDAPKPDPAPEPPQAAAPPDAECLSEEELAALPRIEDLIAGSDIRAFLRAGVPRPLRNAALRRIWMLTPSVRDYRDPAVDYAWDWNTPGGVPGDGAAPSPERAAEMLRNLRSSPERPTAPDAGPDAAPDGGDAPEEAAAAPADPPDAAALDAPDHDPAKNAREGDEIAAGPAPDHAPRRRHGSALPG